MPRTLGATIIPTVEQMQAMGLVPCLSQPCPIWVDPANRPSRRCLTHQHQERRRVQAERGRRPNRERRW